MRSLVELWTKAPVTTVVLFAYVALALITFQGEPWHGNHAQTLRLGAMAPILVIDGGAWRLLASAFLHWGLVHLGLNAWALLVIGPPLEAHYRSARFALLYLVGALGSAIVFQLWNNPEAAGAGGSGALFAMLGAALAFHVRAGRTLTEFLDNYGSRQLLSLIALNLAIGLMIPVISQSAHVGGLIAGFVLGFCFLDRGRWRPDRLSRVIQAGWILLLVSLLLWTLFPVTRVDWRLREASPQVFRMEVEHLLRGH